LIFKTINLPLWQNAPYKVSSRIKILGIRLKNEKRYTVNMHLWLKNDAFCKLKGKAKFKLFILIICVCLNVIKNRKTLQRSSFLCTYSFFNKFFVLTKFCICSILKDNIDKIQSHSCKKWFNSKTYKKLIPRKHSH
jgi:hypothetical protein